MLAVTAGQCCPGPDRSSYHHQHAAACATYSIEQTGARAPPRVRTYPTYVACTCVFTFACTFICCLYWCLKQAFFFTERHHSSRRNNIWRTSFYSTYTPRFFSPCCHFCTFLLFSQWAVLWQARGFFSQGNFHGTVSDISIDTPMWPYGKDAPGRVWTQRQATLVSVVVSIYLTLVDIMSALSLSFNMTLAVACNIFRVQSIIIKI
jgi:hypothetical protein